MAHAVILLLGCATLIAALWASGLALWTRGLTGGNRPWLALVALGTTVVAVLQLANDGDAVIGAGWVAGMLLVAATISAIGIGVFDQNEVNAQSVLGAICVYLLLGLLFTQIYGVVAVLGDGPLFVQAAGDGTASLRLYFSYVTLATLGYGDLTPAATVGHTLAVGEALVGQLYLVTVVAVIVSRVGRREALR